MRGFIIVGSRTGNDEGVHHLRYMIFRQKNARFVLWALKPMTSGSAHSSPNHSTEKTLVSI
jgi:hypothetical protein